MRLDRVLERAAVNLHRVGHTGSRQRAGENHRSHDQVVGERDVGPRTRDHIGDGRHVGLDVSVDLFVAQLVERASLDVLVGVGHVHRKQTADFGPIDGRPGGTDLAHRQLASVPVGDGTDEIELVRVTVLAEQVDLVAKPHQGRHKAGGVDV